MEFFEVVRTQRSIRQFKPEPVPEEAVWEILDAAIRAARALNLGTVLTTFNIRVEDVIRREFGLPDDAKPVAVIPIGYPDGQQFGPTTRKPVESVTFWDDWGQTRRR
jgi:nitroreductase